MVCLWGAGGQHRYLSCRCGVRKALGLPPLLELVASPGERFDLRAGEPGDVGHPVVDRLPTHPQALRQLVSEDGFVEVAGGELMPV
ncbi:hypothetical protein BMS3Abin02_01465 [bacterium BMS3Abin02]|nr:hypothetical protein BMS3Abin02_01465 [bacterium BMS3Abin02]